MTRTQGAVTLGSERRATSGPSPYSQDLSEGLCVGDWDFPDLSQAAQWASCSRCPVRARCWAAAEEPDEIRIAKASARHRRGESWGTICADLGLSHVELWRKLTAADEDALRAVAKTYGHLGGAADLLAAGIAVCATVEDCSKLVQAVVQHAPHADQQ